MTLVGITVRAVVVRHQLRARRADDAAWSKTQAEPVLNLGQNATTKQVVALRIEVVVHLRVPERIGLSIVLLVRR